MIEPNFSPLVQMMAPPPVPAVKEWAEAYQGAHGPLTDLSQAVPGYPPHPDILRWLAEQAASPDMAGYGDIEGEPELRAAYAAEVSAVYGAAVSPAETHITAGCNQAFVAAILAIAAPGDTVLLSNPCYFNHQTSLEMFGIEVAHFACDPADGFVPDPETIIAAITPRTRALALVTPNNPTGAVYPPAVLEAVFELCAENGIWLILDETYRDFLPEDCGAPHDLLTRKNWQKTLIGLYSFSKSFCIPGHRLGAIIAGDEAIAQISKVMDNLQICAPRVPQIAIARALPALEDWRLTNRREVARRTVALKSAMAQAPGFHIDAVGAYFAFVRHPFGTLSSVEAARLLAEHYGVVTIPGAFFGDGLDAYLRIAFTNADVPGISALSTRLSGIGISQRSCP